MKSAIQWVIAMCALGLVLSGTAQVPEFINYQGRLTSSTGAPLVNDPANAADGQIDLVFRLYDAETNGLSVWSQTHANVAVNNGLFSVLLGGLNTNHFPTNALVARWLEVEVRAGAVTNTLWPRKEIVSVAYAIRAGDADMVDGKHASELGGFTNEVDPTVTNWVKDGVNWMEIRDIAGDMPLGFADGIDDIGVTNWSQLITNGMPAGFADGIDDVGITLETDPTVVGWVKDGESWAELKGQGMPAGFTDDVDNVGITVETDPTVTNWVKNGVTWVEMLQYGELQLPETNVMGAPTGSNVMWWASWVSAWAHTNMVTNLNADMLDGYHATDLLALVASNEVDPTVVNWVKDGESWTEMKGQGMPAGFADDIDNIGITNEVDPTVVGWVKDGESWAELKGQGMPAGFADDVDNVGISEETDPQVGANTANYVPTWNSSALVKGQIYDPNTGNIGIGTPSPVYKLHVTGDIYANGGWLRTSGGQGWYSESYGGGWFMQDSSWVRTYNEKSVWTAGGLLGSAGGLTVGYGGASPAGGGAIIASNVGIGTTIPGYKLDVTGDIRAAGVIYADANGAMYFDGGDDAALWDVNVANTMGIYGQQNSAQGHIKLGSSGPTISGVSGNIGIGTVAPVCKLDVNGDAVIRGPLYLSYSDCRIQVGAGQPFLALASWQFGPYATVLVPPDGGFMVADHNNYGPNMHVTDNGNVIAKGQFYPLSDDRIKLNEQKLESGLTLVMALEPKRYDRMEWGFDPETEELIFYPEKISRTNEIGLVAQDVQKVIPEAVHIPEDENRELWSLSYDTIIPVLVKAIQEQQGQIESLKEEVQALKSGPGRVRKNKRRHKKGIVSKKRSKMSRRGRSIPLPFHLLTSVLSPTAMGRVVLSIVVMYIFFDSAWSAQLAAGYLHSLAVKEDGTICAWGLNSNGQLGDGTSTDRWTAVQVSGLINVVSIDAGFYHSLAVKQDGTVWAWGRNDYGELGDGTDERRYTPVQVVGLSGVIALSGGDGFSLALRNDGIVWGWGANFAGALGDGTTTHRATPGQVVGLSEVIAISAGDSHSLALKRDGTVWAWGANGDGELGDGTTSNRLTPVQVSGLTNVISISAGSDYSLALKRDGTVWAWGDNAMGQLGDGNERTKSLIPVQSLVSGVIAMAGGVWNSFALTSYGTVWFWGWIELDFGGSHISSIIPIPVNDIAGVQAIAGGGNHLLALKNDGAVWALGWNMFGQLGDGTTTKRAYPVQVQGLSLAASSVADYALAADFDSDGCADPIAANGSGQWCVWYSHQSYTRDGPYSLGMSSTPVAGDVDGDGQADMGMVQNGQWYIWLSSHGYSQSGPYTFGVSGSPVLADFDGDGKADPAMVDASGGWQVFLSGSGYSQVSAAFGVSGGTPVAGDFDGDGKADPVMVDSAGNWYFWLSGSYYIQSGPYNFGVNGKPIAGDFDGDGKADPAMMDASGNWYIWPSGSFYILDGPYYLVLP